MTSAADILPGHRGTCHRARAFSDPKLADAAARVERDYAQPYLSHRAVLRIVPIVIEFRARPHEEEGDERRPLWRRRLRNYIGEGVAVRVDAIGTPTDRGPGWLREAEADMIVRRRRETRDEWTELHPPDEVEALLRRQADMYLRQFALPAASSS